MAPSVRATKELKSITEEADRECEGIPVAAYCNMSLCRRPRGVQRGEDPLRFFYTPKSGGSRGLIKPNQCFSETIAV
jgi:hypothetical protein